MKTLKQRADELLAKNGLDSNGRFLYEVPLEQQTFESRLLIGDPEVIQKIADQRQAARIIKEM